MEFPIDTEAKGEGVFAPKDADTLKFNTSPADNCPLTTILLENEYKTL
jgi:hypothetical protein